MPSSPPASERLTRSEEHTSELQSLRHLVCRLLLEKKNAGCAAGSRSAPGARSNSPRRCRHRLSASAGAIHVAPASHFIMRSSRSACFFFNDTATTEIYTLSLHDALPILRTGSTPSLLICCASTALLWPA